MAAMNEPAETALRVNTLRVDPAQGRRGDRRRRAGVERAGRAGPLAPPEAWSSTGPLTAGLSPTDRRRGAGRPGARLAGGGVAARPTPRRSGCSTSAPLRGSRRRRSRRGCRTGASSSRSSSTRAGRGGCASSAAPGRRAACGWSRRTPPASTLGGGYDRILVDPPCSDLGTLASRPDARWRKDRGLIERLAGLQAEDPGSGGPGARRRRRAGLLDLHDLGARERAPGRGVGGRGGSTVRRRPRGPPSGARPPQATAASCRRGPIAIAPTASSSPGCAAGPRGGAERLPDDGGGALRPAGVPRLRRAVASPHPAPGPLPVRLLPAALRAGLAVPQLRRAPDDRPHERLRGPALPALRPLDAEARMSEVARQAFSRRRVAPSILSADFARLGDRGAR